ncbi:hypothetical protein M409DRAFT_59411 [Zasmidium cellare ATCC 36951]|uniref:Uncharacterized protein n=1 Tax=Zasmidium cellare ATCC 36951 TaxID=1080233 RepID=A0A6A6C5K4_ZASCE|nr:uncharacterized protein M409DRAFT_59411 [Zasmidium cellare ATCC 36951]KAF2161152.1 hypothetical protein M409DRAFT_59411 [Zasmidium cellare ATCC 36951]
MVTNKLDGLFVQRFYSTTEENTPGSGYNATLGVLLTVKEMGEKYGKYFAVEYIPALTDDYNNVMKPLFESPNYIYQDGRPVLQIWGVGTNATAFPGDKFHDLINRYHSTPENPWIILGVPQTWMEFANTTNDPTGFYEAYQAAEALQSWPVGAWNDVDSLRGALNQYILPGKALLDAWGVKYMGAYHPGTGNRNAARRPGEPIGPLDNRFNGTFFEESIKLFTNDSIKPFANFIAMFDEYTEGSQLVPYIQFKSLPPNPNPGFLGSDDDKNEFFYMQLAGNGTAALHELWVHVRQQLQGQVSCRFPLSLPLHFTVASTHSSSTNSNPTTTRSFDLSIPTSLDHIPIHKRGPQPATRTHHRIMSSKLYTQPRASQMATLTALTQTPTHPSSGDTSPITTSSPPTLTRKPTNNYEEARLAANQSLPADGSDAGTTGPTSPNATKEDLKRWQHEGLFAEKKGGNVAGYHSTSG